MCPVGSARAANRNPAALSCRMNITPLIEYYMRDINTTPEPSFQLLQNLRIKNGRSEKGLLKFRITYIIPNKYEVCSNYLYDY